ncbi:CDC16 protein [Lithohypha guttulata]|uniref:CDC16 protein n=1 Tax=Lithohypha guttulata TaxID=1690604 RepID=A0AAN7T213_9EURO|nr:CDC16 protein [Lithohypha guttulata]KAK5087108.1 CDC16 protein [Lithohypha guttulata]KAK5099828.1 CDC16 protein [Lithohypha guttulata]
MNASPDKNIRRLRSHQQLSSAARNSYQTSLKNTSSVRPARDQLLPQAKTTDSLPTRTRASSDAPVPFERTRLQRKPLQTILQPSNGHARKSSLEVTLRDGPAPGTKPAASLGLLRHSILMSGVQATKEGMSDYRIYLWLTLLNLGPLPTDNYLTQIHRGRSPAHEKIANDVFRTLATDALFKRRVSDASLTRVLNATAWRILDSQKAIPSESPVIQSTYIQGMNVLSAPFLYAARSEAQAYALLTCLLSEHIPTYVTSTMSGVHAGLELIDKILATISPKLSQFLLSNSLPAKIYAFAPVLTLCACTPPLPEVLKLWDFLFAFGTHLNVLCIVAQIMMMKDKLLESPSPGKLLRSFPNLNAEEIIKGTLLIVRDLPEDIYAEVVRHGRV